MTTMSHTIMGDDGKPVRIYAMPKCEKLIYHRYYRCGMCGYHVDQDLDGTYDIPECPKCDTHQRPGGWVKEEYRAP